MQHDLKRKFRDIKQEADGSFSFDGKTYCLADGDAGVKSTRLRLTGGIVLLAACVIGSGCIDAAGASDAAYVILPFIGEVSALFVLCWNMAKLASGIFTGGGRSAADDDGNSNDSCSSGEGGKDGGNLHGVRDYVLEKAGMRIPPACTMLALFAGAGLCLSTVYLIRNGTGEETFKSAAYVLLKLTSVYLALWYKRQFAGAAWVRAV